MIIDVEKLWNESLYQYENIDNKQDLIKRYWLDKKNRQRLTEKNKIDLKYDLNEIKNNNNFNKLKNKNKIIQAIQWQQMFDYNDSIEIYLSKKITDDLNLEKNIIVTKGNTEEYDYTLDLLNIEQKIFGRRYDKKIPIEILNKLKQEKGLTSKENKSDIYLTISPINKEEAVIKLYQTDILKEAFNEITEVQLKILKSNNEEYKDKVKKYFNNSENQSINEYKNGSTMINIDETIPFFELGKIKIIDNEKIKYDISQIRYSNHLEDIKRYFKIMKKVIDLNKFSTKIFYVTNDLKIKILNSDEIIGENFYIQDKRLKSIKTNNSIDLTQESNELKKINIWFKKNK
jgi:hypothetical protein